MNGRFGESGRNGSELTGRTSYLIHRIAVADCLQVVSSDKILKKVSVGLAKQDWCVPFVPHTARRL
jgi:hypothetical protein